MGKHNNRTFKTLKHISSSQLSLLEQDIKTNYTYQVDLTHHLDSYKEVFDQNLVNEIILWKVNCHVKVSDAALDAINAIPIDETATLDEGLTETALRLLLDQTNMRLLTACTLLRFRNPHIYQMLDHRIYRIVIGTELLIPDDMTAQLTIYLNYLKVLREVCDKHKIAYHLCDRTLYRADRTILNPYPPK